MTFSDWVYRWFLDTHGECLGMGNDAAFVRTATECLYDTLSDEDRARYGAHI